MRDQHATSRLSPYADLGTDPIMRGVERGAPEPSTEALAGSDFTQPAEALIAQVARDAPASSQPSRLTHNATRDEIAAYMPGFLDDSPEAMIEAVQGSAFSAGDALRGLRQLFGDAVRQMIDGRLVDAQVASPNERPREPRDGRDLDGIWHDIATRLADVGATASHAPAGHIALDRDTFGRVRVHGGPLDEAAARGWSLDPERDLRRMHEATLYMSGEPPRDATQPREGQGDGR